MGARLAVGLLVGLVSAGCDRSPSATPPLPVTASAAPPIDADAPDAPPPYDSPAGKLSRSVGSSLDYAERYVYFFGGGRMRVVDDTFVLVTGDANAPLGDAMKTVHETVQSLWHDPGWHRATQAATVWVFSSPDIYVRFSKGWGRSRRPR